MTRTTPPGFINHLLARFGSDRPAAQPTTSQETSTFPHVRASDIAAAQYVHDLRNQLSVMKGCAERIARLLPDGTGETEVGQLLASMDRADRLTREVLRTAPSCGVTQPADINEIAMAVVSSLGSYISGGVTLRARLPLEPVLVSGMPADLERIVVNLVLNSFEAIDGSGTITVETGMTVASSRLEVDGPPPTGRYARLVVTDTGCGMLPEVRAHMFEPFFTTKPGGTGLGLSSVAYTVRRLGGRIVVESQPGRGTAITVHLPSPS